ncbi:MAG: ABC transporter ATP-binding protein [Janthinobacterium lividum]
MSTAIESVIEVSELSKRVGDAGRELTILEDIDFRIDAGEKVAIVGESGSGKSTLLGLLAGLDRPTAGTVKLLGQDLAPLDENQRAALRLGRVGFVFQSFQLMPHLTALENVMLPAELGGSGATGANHAQSLREVRERATALLDQVGLSKRLTHYPRLLSGGEQQRVALARAFMTAPAVLLADEPTGSLDAANGRAIVELMFEMNRASGATLVLVTHDADLAARCDRTIGLKDGRIVTR